MSMERLQQLYTAKLAHYNDWLRDPKRELGTSKYPGFPQQDEIARLSGFATEAKPTKVKSQPTGVKQPKGESKLDQARKLFNPTMSRAETIKLFVEQLGMTKAGASTYHHKLAKQG